MFMRFKRTLVGLLSTTVLFSGIAANGLLEPKTTVKAATNTATYKTSATSEVGQMKTINSRLYTAPGSTKSVAASTKYTNELFYVMKKATVTKTGEVFYQVSRQNTANATVLGWVKSKSLKRAAYKSMTNTKKTFYIKGTGAGYTRAGGLSRNIIIPKMSVFKNTTFTNKATVKIGTTTWYSATVDGLTVWLPSTALSTTKVVKVAAPVVATTSKIAKVKSTATIIQTDLEKSSTAAKAGILANQALIVTKTATYNNVKYYNLLADGIDLGWVKQSDVTAYNYVAESAYKATHYILGGGYGYTIPWGAKDDIITKDLLTLKDTPFTITKKATVGKTAWYYGTTNTKKAMWISSSRLTPTEPKPAETTPAPTPEPEPTPVPPVVETPVKDTIVYTAQKKQGVLKTAGVIYKDLVKLEAKTVTTNEKTEKFTINQSAKIGSTTYYELSRLSTAAKTTVVGWVKSNEVTLTTVAAPVASSAILYLSGEGNATNIAGGTAAGNSVFKDLKSYPATKFTATKSQKIGAVTYYLGKIGTKYAWVSEANFGQPYRYFNLRKVSDIKQTEMEAYLVKKKGESIKTNNLYKNIPDFLAMQKKYGINAQFMLAHAIWETGWGTSKISQYKNNFFGYQAYDSCAMTCSMYFGTGQDGIQYYADAIYRKYLKVGAIYNNGTSPAGMNVKYATDKTWAQNIARLMEEMKPYSSAYYDQVTPSTLDPALPTFTNTNVIPTGKPLPPSYHYFDTGVTATTTLPTPAKLLPYVYGKDVMTYAVGTKITLNGTNDDVSSKWMRVLINGTEAWVSRSAIKIDNLGQVTTEANIRNKATTTNSTVLAVAAANSFVKLSLDSKGQPVTEKDASKTIWYQVQIPNKKTTGWISSTIIKIN